MSAPLRIAQAQFNACVGDIAANARRIGELAAHARDEFGADLVVFPELALTGYPPEDLLFRPGLHRRVAAALNRLAADIHGIHLLVGYAEPDGDALYNSCVLLAGGKRVANYRKQHLPNYAVFDEKRYFTPGSDAAVVTELNGYRLALSICEDIWNPPTAVAARDAGADLMININASPYHTDKQAERAAAVAAAAAAGKLPVVYVNTVGGQDELVFDGASFAMMPDGRIVAQAPAFEEALSVVECTRDGDRISLAGECATLPAGEASVYQALVLGVRDYIGKNHFEGCVIGLSGGIDSALTLAVAVDALGPEAVTAVSMPSAYTAQMSVEDARREATTLGCRFEVVSIGAIVDAFTATIDPLLVGGTRGVTAENLQARSRGVILMALSNATRSIVLATGNKSEMAVGYATLYGDMAGGFAPLKDIAKTLVYRLSEWRNRHGEVIPRRVIERPPTAELAPDQKDSDSLPPYDILDPILEQYIERDMTPREIAAGGFDLDEVRRVARMVDRNEYKRRQAAPGVRVTKRAFGRDRRFPITSRYDEQTPT